MVRFALEQSRWFYAGDPRGGLALALIVMILTALALGLVVRSLRRRGLTVQTAGI